MSSSSSGGGAGGGAGGGNDNKGDEPRRGSSGGTISGTTAPPSRMSFTAPRVVPRTGTSFSGTILATRASIAAEDAADAAKSTPRPSFAAAASLTPTAYATANSAGYIPCLPHGYDLEATVYDEATHTVVCVARRGPRVVVAFRGTSSTRNLYADLNFSLRAPSFLEDEEAAAARTASSSSAIAATAALGGRATAGGGGGGSGGMLSGVAGVGRDAMTAAASAASSSLSTAANAAGAIARHVPGVRLALPQVRDVWLEAWDERGVGGAP